MPNDTYPHSGPNWRERWQPRLPHPSWIEEGQRPHAAPGVTPADFWRRLSL